jgi:hypothetical protein
MKKSISFLCVLSCALWLTSASLCAQGRGNVGRPEVGGSAKQHDGGNAKESNEARRGDVDARIEHNPELKANVTHLLPAGMDLKTASSGFKNEGQFIAALHVSKNLNIPFADLQARMTGPNAESLGKAIHDLKPALSEADARKEAEKAEKQAKATEKGTRIS